MHKRQSEFVSFVSHFVRYMLFVRGVLTALLLLLLLSGFMISWIEGLSLGRALYFTFITGLSIGYGDITPKTGWGCVASIGVGMLGMILTGMTVAIATRALADATRERKGHK